MQVITLEDAANQQINVTLDGNRWTLRIKETNGCMSADVSLNEQVVVLGQRVVAGTPFLPYRFQQLYGNFIILTDNEELPYWDSFTTGQILLYASVAEVGAVPATGLVWGDLIGYEIIPTDPNWRITTDFQQRITTDGLFRIVSV